MSLTKDQLKKIDQYLKRKGIDFWDVRYELLDHIACILEEKIAQDMHFEKAFTAIEKNFSRPILKKQQNSIKKNLNKKIVKTYGRELIKVFVTPLRLLSVIGLTVLMLFVAENYSVSSSVKMGGTLVIFLIIFVLIAIYRNYKFHGKSLLLNLAGSTVIFLIYIPQIVSYFFGGKEVALKEYPFVMISSIILTYILTFSWYTGYNKLVKQQQNYYNLIHA